MYSFIHVVQSGITWTKEDKQCTSLLQIPKSDCLSQQIWEAPTGLKLSASENIGKSRKNMSGTMQAQTPDTKLANTNYDCGVAKHLPLTAV